MKVAGETSAQIEESDASNPPEKQERESLMRTSHWKTLGRVPCIACLVVLLGANLAAAQTSTGGTVRGQVTDPSGGAMTDATISLTTTTGTTMDTTTNKDGVYEFRNLEAGNYEIKAVAKGFALFT